MARTTTHNGKPLAFHQDVAAGLGLLAACGILFWMTRGFPTVPAMLSQNVPPTFFPRLVLLVIALLSTALIIRGLRLPRATEEPVHKRVFVTAGIVTAAIAGMPWLGMLLTVSLLAIVMPIAWGERRYGPLVVLAVALPIAIHVIFTLALGIRFPWGLLGTMTS